MLCNKGNWICMQIVEIKDDGEPEKLLALILQNLIITILMCI